MQRIVILAIVLAACGGGGADDPGSTTTTLGGPVSTPDQPATSTTQNGGGPGSTQTPGGSGEYDHASFVLCPTLGGHRDELAAIVGLEPESGQEFLGSSRTNCELRTESGDIIVDLMMSQFPPGYASALAFHADSYDGTSPAPELGDGAVYRPGPIQTLVLFGISNLVIAVEYIAGTVDPPPRDSLIELALRIREILTEANS